MAQFPTTKRRTLALTILVILGLAGFAGLAWTQQVLVPSPAAAVCAYSSSPPAVPSRNFVYVQCDPNGNLLMD